MSDKGTDRKIGIIGVGRMGLAMAKHLRAKGFDVIANDVSTDAVAEAEGLGATRAATPAALGAASDFVIVAVGFDNEVLQVVLGTDGCLGEMAEGSILAVSATVAPETIGAIEAVASKKGVIVLDAPICRGRFFADAGELLALFGGGDEAVARGRAVYASFCSDIEVVGGTGAGQVAKAINNLMLWVTSVGLIEAGRLAESKNLDLVKLRDALMKSSAKSQALEDWDQTSFTWALKDMQIVGQMADASGLSLPLTGSVKEMVKEARRIKATDAPAWTG